jgi:hypothetical protein
MLKALGTDAHQDGQLTGQAGTRVATEGLTHSSALCPWLPSPGQSCQHWDTEQEWTVHLTSPRFLIFHPLKASTGHHG